MAYIDVVKAVRHLRGKCVAKYPTTFLNGILASADEISKLPTADVVEVKRGKWIVNDLEIAVEYTCSVCGYTYCEADSKQLPEKYCCKCGGKNE